VSRRPRNKEKQTAAVCSLRPRPLGSEIWSVLSRSSGRPRNCIPDNVPTGLAPKASEKLGSNTLLVVRLPSPVPRS